MIRGLRRGSNIGITGWQHQNQVNTTTTPVVDISAEIFSANVISVNRTGASPAVNELTLQLTFVNPTLAFGSHHESDLANLYYTFSCSGTGTSDIRNKFRDLTDLMGERPSTGQFSTSTVWDALQAQLLADGEIGSLIGTPASSGELASLDIWEALARLLADKGVRPSTPAAFYSGKTLWDAIAALRVIATINQSAIGQSYGGALPSTGNEDTLRGQIGNRPSQLSHNQTLWNYNFLNHTATERELGNQATDFPASQNANLPGLYHKSVWATANNINGRLTTLENHGIAGVNTFRSRTWTATGAYTCSPQSAQQDYQRWNGARRYDALGIPVSPPDMILWAGNNPPGVSAPANPNDRHVRVRWHIPIGISSQHRDVSLRLFMGMLEHPYQSDLVVDPRYSDTDNRNLWWSEISGTVATITSNPYWTQYPGYVDEARTRRRWGYAVNVSFNYNLAHTNRRPPVMEYRYRLHRPGAHTSTGAWPYQMAFMSIPDNGTGNDDVTGTLAMAFGFAGPDGGPVDGLSAGGDPGLLGGAPVGGKPGAAYFGIGRHVVISSLTDMTLERNGLPHGTPLQELFFPAGMNGEYTQTFSGSYEVHSPPQDFHRRPLIFWVESYAPGTRYGGEWNWLDEPQQNSRLGTIVVGEGYDRGGSRGFGFRQMPAQFEVSERVTGASYYLETEYNRGARWNDDFFTNVGLPEDTWPIDPNNN